MVSSFLTGNADVAPNADGSPAPPADPAIDPAAYAGMMPYYAYQVDYAGQMYPVCYGTPYDQVATAAMESHVDYQYYSYLQSSAAAGFYVCDSEGNYFWQPFPVAAGEAAHAPPVTAAPAPAPAPPRAAVPAAKLDPAAKEFVPSKPSVTSGPVQPSPAVTGTTPDVVVEAK